MRDAKGVADKMFAAMRKGLEGLSDVDRALTEEMLKEYAWLCANVLALREKIDREGAIVEVEKGNNSFKHMESVENPAIKTLVRLQTQKSAYYTKLHKVMDIDEPDSDELDAWLKDNG